MFTTTVKRTAAALALSGAVIAGSVACSADDQTDTESAFPTTTAFQAEAAEDTPMSAEEIKDTAFDMTLRKRGIPATEDARKAGHATCDALESGISLQAVARIASQAYGSADGAYIAGAAVGAYCPEFSTN